MSNRIEQIIGDIEEYIDGCKMQPFSSTRIIVERPQVEEYLDELRHCTPEEVKKYQRMLNNRDKILADAKEKAADVENRAQQYAERLVAENNITKMAYEKADEILRNANEQADKILSSANADAEAIRSGAISYTNEMMTNLLAVINGTIEDSKEHYGALLSSLSEHQKIVSQNLNELSSVSTQPDFNAEEDDDFKINTNGFFAAEEDDE